MSKNTQMNLKHHTTKILVVDLGTQENRWLMFCGYDEVKDRLIFFKELHMGSLPNYSSQAEVTITVTRDDKEFSKGSPYLIGGHIETYHLSGLKEIMKDNKQIDLVQSFYFQVNDIVTIEKFDWKESEIPLDTIATRRTVGDLFWEAFLDDQPLFEQLSYFFPKMNSVTTRAVFESYPGSKYAAHF